MVSSLVLPKTVVSFQIPPAQLQQFEIEISNVNPHYHNETKTLNIGDLLSVSRRHGFERPLNVGKIIVYKVGACTDLSVSYFIKPPPGMYGRDVGSRERSLWWDSLLHCCFSDSEDSVESGSYHSGGIWQFNISKKVVTTATALMI